MISMATLLLENGANPNAYTRAGLSVLVYPILRGENSLKQLLYQYGAKLDFALDFINAKLIGHRFELTGDVDIVNAEGEFVELDYEGFILEFTVSIVKDSLRRFIHSFSSKHLRIYFSLLSQIINGFDLAESLLKLQQYRTLSSSHINYLDQCVKAPMLILPAASQGHALCFIHYMGWWAKIDRGENSKREGSVICIV